MNAYENPSYVCAIDNINIFKGFSPKVRGVFRILVKHPWSFLRKMITGFQKSTISVNGS